MQKNNFLNTNIKLSHSRMSLSGIFNARRCSYEIGKSLLNKQPLRGRSPITAFGDDDLGFYNGNNGRVEDPGVRAALASSGMTLCDSGFTLIELLVVVLIIGILAAIALPQYQKAVNKAQFTKLYTRVNAIRKAAQVYYLANNEYPTDIRDLDIDISEPGAQFGQTSVSVEIHTGIIYQNGDECAIVRPTRGEFWCHNNTAWLAYISDQNKWLCHPITDQGTDLCKSISNGEKNDYDDYEFSF